MRRIHTIKLAGLLGTAILSVPVSAQTVTTSAEAAEQTDGLSDIIVTARRRAEPQQDTPLAVSAIDGARLQEARVTTLADVTNLTPSINLARSSVQPAAIYPFIRGFGSKSTDPAAEPPIAVTIDGMYRASLVGTFINLFDVEGVEVLRGPQGTLLGKNAPAGGVAIRTRRPGDELAVQGQIEYGSFENVHASGWVDVPLVPGALFATVSANYQHSDGFVRHLVTGRRFGGVDTRSIRGALLAELGDSTTWYVSAQYDIDQGEDPGSRNITTTAPLLIPGLTLAVQPGVSRTCTSAYSSALCTNGTLPNNRPHTTQVQNIRQRDNRSFSITSNLDFDTGPANFAIVTGFHKFNEFTPVDVDGTSLSLLESEFDGNFRTFSQEVRFASSDGGGLDMGGRLNWLVGAYFFNFEYDRFNRSIALGGPSVTYQEADSKSYALFAHAEYEVLPDLSLSGGIRQTWDRKTHLSRAQRFFAGIDPEFAQRSADNNISYDVTLNYNFARDSMIYARRATGYRGGGFTGTPATAAAVSSAEPETVGAWEFGSKNDFFNHRLRVNLSVFHNKFDDLQRVVFTPIDVAPFFVQRLINVATAVTQGVEVELQARPVRALTLRANVGYLDAKYTSFSVNVTGNPLNGNSDLTFLQFPYVSEWTTQLGATYDLDLGSSGELAFVADYYYRSSYNVSDNNYDNLAQKGVGLLSGSVTWRAPNDHFTLSVFGRNLTNEDYIDGGDPVGGLTTFVSEGMPREWGVSAGFRF